MRSLKHLASESSSLACKLSFKNHIIYKGHNQAEMIVTYNLPSVLEDLQLEGCFICSNLNLWSKLLLDFRSQ